MQVYFMCFVQLLLKYLLFIYSKFKYLKLNYEYFISLPQVFNFVMS